MSTTVKTRNGIDTQQLLDTIDAIQNDDSLAQFTFKARSAWEDGTHSVGRIGRFVHAGNED